MSFENYLDISPEVKSALDQGRPVVALESTIIAHGMPYPDNVQVALQVENIIREYGVVPATIAILGGRLKVGLTPDEIEYLGTKQPVYKVTRRDIALACAMKYDCATTVAGTMMLANMAGIKLFVTGGIGGVHRGWEETLDISADLPELSNTDVAVVCAGCKSILDIPATLEYLETSGVPVITYGQDNFPAFYCSDSGIKAELRLDSPDDIAAVINAKHDLGLKGGVLIANPVPKELELPREIMEPAVNQALKEAKEQGITGKRTTPFLLTAVKNLTGGDSLEANKQLVYNNARLGAQIARLLK